VFFEVSPLVFSCPFAISITHHLKFMRRGSYSKGEFIFKHLVFLIKPSLLSDCGGS